MNTRDIKPRTVTKKIPEEVLRALIEKSREVDEDRDRIAEWEVGERGPSEIAR